TSFHHQPEAQHPNFPLSVSWQADYPIFWGQSGHGLSDGVTPTPPFHNLSSANGARKGAKACQTSISSKSQRSRSARCRTVVWSAGESSDVLWGYHCGQM